MRLASARDLSGRVRGWPQRWPDLSRFHVAFILGTVLVTGVAWGVAFVADVTSRLPASDEIGSLGVMANATVIYDAFDQPVFTLFRERRLSVPLHDISPHLVTASHRPHESRVRITSGTYLRAPRRGGSGTAAPMAPYLEMKGDSR